LIKAIITQLKTGSLTRVYPKGSNIVTPIAPYIFVWGPAFISQGGNDGMGQNQYMISVHYQKGFINQLDDYIYNELLTLLHKKKMITRDLRTVTLYLNGSVSEIIEGNKDGTISKERDILTAAIYT